MSPHLLLSCGHDRSVRITNISNGNRIVEFSLEHQVSHKISDGDPDPLCKPILIHISGGLVSILISLHKMLDFNRVSKCLNVVKNSIFDLFSMSKKKIKFKHLIHVSLSYLSKTGMKRLENC